MPLLLSLIPALLCFPLRGLQCCCSPCPRQIYVTAMEIKLWSRLNLDHLTAHMCLKKKCQIHVTKYRLSTFHKAQPQEKHASHLLSAVIGLCSVALSIRAAYRLYFKHSKYEGNVWKLSSEPRIKQNRVESKLAEVMNGATVEPRNILKGGWFRMVWRPHGSCEGAEEIQALLCNESQQGGKKKGN